jgi:hypothetical protein
MDGKKGRRSYPGSNRGLRNVSNENQNPPCSPLHYTTYKNYAKLIVKITYNLINCASLPSSDRAGADTGRNE